jgi:hypothetical protein
VALVHGSGLHRTMGVIRPRPGVTTDEVPEAEPVQVHEVPIQDSQIDLSTMRVRQLSTLRLIFTDEEWESMWRRPMTNGALSSQGFPKGEATNPTPSSECD